MDSTELDRLVEVAGEHIGGVIKMMFDGVAFPDEVLGVRNNKQYVVFSHEGDRLGFIATADMNYAISFMKRQGREVGKETGYGNTRFDPAFTFAWVGWY